MSYQSRKLLSLGAAMLISASNLFAQSAEEVIKKHNEAVGGTAAWAKVNSLRFTGVMNMMGMEMNVVMTKLRNAGVRQDVEMMGTKTIVVMTPEKGWMITPEKKEPVDLPAENVQASKTQLWVGDMVIEMGNNGYKFESAGMSTLDGKPVVPGKGTADGDQYIRIKALDKDGNATDLYFDPKTYYLVKTGRMMAVQGQEMEVGLNFSEFQKQDGGIVMAMAVKSESGDMKFSKVEVNPAVDAALFKP